MPETLPVAVIGAGPVGLAAAAHLVRRGLDPLILERGPAAGAAVRAWGHVRVFTPWAYLIDDAARALLAATGWAEPDPDTLPTGAEIVDAYLAPLAHHPALARHLMTGAKVEAVAREGMSRMDSAGRGGRPFVLAWRDRSGGEHRVRARAVIDASGTWDRPNPMGADGLPVPGEHHAAERIAYGLPDVAGRARPLYAGRHTLLIGGGHSAINVALDLMALAKEAPGTRLTWGLRRAGIDRLVGGGEADELPARGGLGLAARRAIEAGGLDLKAAFAVDRVERAGHGLRITAKEGDRPVRLEVDRIVVATGFRPDLAMLRELRVALDPVTEAPPKLAPLIDPNIHACGTVPPHGVEALAHPEPGFYIVGMKAYGRAPTFLLPTGYEQVRSVVAELAGDHAAARRVALTLPETGVCGGSAGSDCCPPPSKPEAAGCCRPPRSGKAEAEAPTA